MTDEQVRDEALTLFLAGHETTAIALTWTWWLLARNPDAETRLHAELDTMLPDREPSVEDLAEPPVHAGSDLGVDPAPPTGLGDGQDRRRRPSGERATRSPRVRPSWSRRGSCTTIPVGGPILRRSVPSAGSSRTPSDRGTRSSRSAAVRACASGSRSRGWRRRCSSRRSRADGGSRAGTTASRTCRPSSRCVRAGAADARAPQATETADGS